MGVAKLAKQCAHGDGFLSIDIDGADFGFGSQSNDVGHDFRHSVNGSIEPPAHYGRLFQIRRAVVEKIMAHRHGFMRGAQKGTRCCCVRI